MEQKRAGAGHQTYNERTATTSHGSQFTSHEFGAPDDTVIGQFFGEDDEGDECAECEGRLANYDGGRLCVYCLDSLHGTGF
jgi:hypothetical protein